MCDISIPRNKSELTGLTKLLQEMSCGATNIFRWEIEVMCDFSGLSYQLRGTVMLKIN